MFFKKNKKKSYKHKVYTLEPKEVNVGFAVIKYTFQDGGVLESTVYGYMDQRLNDDEWTINKTLVSGFEVAQKELSTFNMYEHSVVDDTKNPAVSVYGRVVKKEIINSGDYTDTYEEMVIRLEYV